MLPPSERSPTPSGPGSRGGSERSAQSNRLLPSWAITLPIDLVTRIWRMYVSENVCPERDGPLGVPLLDVDDSPRTARDTLVGVLFGDVDHHRLRRMVRRGELVTEGTIR